MQARETRVSKWGSSLGIRLPKEFTDSVGIDNKSMVQIEIKDGVLQIKPIAELRKRKPLSEILTKALEDGTWDGTPAEISAEDREWLDTPSIGAEVIQYE